MAYTGALLGRVEVRAAHDGIAIYYSPNDWLGKPVVTGQRIMTLADPANAGVRIDLPVSDAIALEPGARVRLFLDTDPLRPLEARLVRTSYEARLTPQGHLAFELDARLPDATPPPRIGLKGTAKLYGEPVPLYYYLLRRPLARLRQWLGI
ncbi:MAG: hypothetical protein B0D96_12165 [Candidatus Sedimenticola endophacoides]|nr:MAG: hypothetical protein B0D94_01130 [Candidatus Sedimenticola endophacoides]OQX33140.1 MAG: hypothetical protein B0D96_12165 [Candidatus Sedimenticola endophacoides]OQX42491.1 MAG: hypothetical protein B0D89_01150 [Candidatus Sedimenticola endophacoides]